MKSETFKLQKITGIGPAKAQKLLEKGITLKTLLDSVDSDAEIKDMLTHHQILGVKYYHDLEHKIPYEEIQKIEVYLKNMLKEYKVK